MQRGGIEGGRACRSGNGQGRKENGRESEWGHVGGGRPRGWEHKKKESKRSRARGGLGLQKVRRGGGGEFQDAAVNPMTMCQQMHQKAASP